MAAAPDIPPFMDKLDVKYTQLFINNEWVPAKDNSTFPTENPATGEVICQVAEAKEADIDAAVAAAVKANKRGSEWRKYGPAKRAALLHKLADLMMRDRQYIASLNCLDAGKVYVGEVMATVNFAVDILRYMAGWADKDHGKSLNCLDAGKVYAGEIMGTIYMAVDILRYMAGWADKDHGKVNPSDDGFFTYTRHEPIGVCGAIIPWNAPLGLACWKLAPCIATGNVLVLKPAELAPLSCLYMAALCKEAGFPPGVVNVVPGYGKTAGSALAHHMDVHKVSFTGSTLTGRAILKAAAESNLKRVSLELGGKSPNIIFPDVDLDMAVEWANTAVFFNNGQICCAGSRCFVHEDIYEEFVRRSVARAKSGVVGDPRHLNTQHGPQISKLQKDKILGMLKTARDEGCTVLCGGEGVKDKKGHFIQPTVLTDLTDDMTVSKEEIFGPVQQIFKFKTMEEVIERANKTSYGLAGAVFTKDINRALTVSNALEAGMIWVNCYFNMFCNTPFGGYKQSGHGREMSEYALREYTEVKSVIVKIDQTLQ